MEARLFLGSSHLCKGITTAVNFLAFSIPSDKGYLSPKCKPRAMPFSLYLMLANLHCRCLHEMIETFRGKVNSSSPMEEKKQQYNKNAGKQTFIDLLTVISDCRKNPDAALIFIHINLVVCILKY